MFVCVCLVVISHIRNWQEIQEDNTTAGGWDDEWASFEGDTFHDTAVNSRTVGHKIKNTSDPFAELQSNSTKRNDRDKTQKEPSWEDFLSSTTPTDNKPHYERKQATPPLVKASLFDKPSDNNNKWGWDDDGFGDWGQENVSRQTIRG